MRNKNDLCSTALLCKNNIAFLLVSCRFVDKYLFKFMPLKICNIYSSEVLPTRMKEFILI